MLHYQAAFFASTFENDVLDDDAKAAIFNVFNLMEPLAEDFKETEIDGIMVSYKIKHKMKDNMKVRF